MAVRSSHEYSAFQSTWTVHVPSHRPGRYRRHAAGLNAKRIASPRSGTAKTSPLASPLGPRASRHFLEDPLQRLGAWVFGGQHRQISQLREVSAIMRRFSLSRKPAEPNTAMTRPLSPAPFPLVNIPLAASSANFNAFGV